MVDRVLGAGIIGCGGIGNCHATALTLIPSVRLVATADIDEARAKAYAHRYHAEAYYADAAQLLERKDIDFVTVTTANNLHAPLTIQALEAGKHVMVQKPMALNMGEARAMIAASKRTGKRLMVSFFELFHPAFRKAKEIVDQGIIGDVFFVKAIMAWYAPSVDVWRFDPKISGGGILMDGHSHHAAFLRWITGEDAVSVYSEHGALASNARVEDTGVTLVRTPKALAELSGSMRLKEPNPQNGRLFKEYLEIFGTNGTIRLLPTERPSILVYSEGASIPRGLNGWFSPRLETVPFEERGRSLHFNADEDPWTGEHKHFAECIREDKPVLTDGEFGAKVLEIAVAGYKSMREGRRISLPLEG
jgi:myo-inositol 2-dehydrogenase/D-chiro-inositol 1-dehydrogenase